MKCCKDCIAPKRHLGCHATCEDYAKAKEEDKAKKKWLKESCHPRISNFDFNEANYIGSKHYNRKDRP